MLFISFLTEDKLVDTLLIEDKIISGSILDAETEELRFEAMKELMDISYNIVNKIPTDGRNIVKNAKMACAYLLDMNGVEECIFMQNADIKYPPMSLTKVLAFMTMSKFIDNYNEWILIKPFDEKNNDIIKNGVSCNYHH